MIKSEKDKQIEALAKEYRRRDGRLSWPTCMKKAKAAHRLFNNKSNLAG